MKTSTTITKIAPALLQAQKEIKHVVKDATNPFFKSKYADLTAVIEAIKEPLNKAGITYLQLIVDSKLETVLLHESGEYISSEATIVSKSPNDPQALGSAITYLKRYSLMAITGLPTEDDDGNLASSPTLVKVAPVAPAVGKCPKCGAANARSKTGGLYCSAKCWLTPQVETEIIS